jgi:hypothetical protein
MHALRTVLPDLQSLATYLSNTISTNAVDSQAATALPLVRDGDTIQYNELLSTCLIGTPRGAEIGGYATLRRPISLRQSCSQHELVMQLLKTLVDKQARVQSQQRLHQPRHLLSLGYRQQRVGTIHGLTQVTTGHMNSTYALPTLVMSSCRASSASSQIHFLTSSSHLLGSFYSRASVMI